MADTDFVILCKELNIYAKIAAKQADALNLERSLLKKNVFFANFMSG